MGFSFIPSKCDFDESEITSESDRKRVTQLVLAPSNQSISVRSATSPAGCHWCSLLHFRVDDAQMIAGACALSSLYT
jgi:hypothetical protein